ncbi:MAG: tetratricopeptide (TPR) repeat protein [Lentimonas sp.]|jgi:tetratricopeptide (TPR) repeat protein
MKNLFALLFLSLLLPINLQAQNADTLFNQGMMNLENNDGKKAEKLFKSAIKMDSTQANYYGMLAYTLKTIEKYQESLDLYMLAIEKFPTNTDLLNGRGNLLLELRYYDNAYDDFTEAIKYAASDTVKFSIYTNRAAASMRKRDFESAYRDLIYAYKFDSTDIAVLTNLGAMCDEVGRGDETLKYLIKVTEIDPDFIPAYGNIGYKYQVMGEHEKAIEYFDMVIEKSDGPEMKGVGHTNRSFSKLKLDDLKGAIKDSETGIKLYPANSYAYTIYARALIEKGKMRGACEALETAIAQGYTITYGEEALELQRKHCKN